MFLTSSLDTYDGDNTAEAASAAVLSESSTVVASSADVFAAVCGRKPQIIAQPGAQFIPIEHDAGKPPRFQRLRYGACQGGFARAGQAC